MAIAPIMDSLSVPEGYDINLTCTMRASPAPTINWYQGSTLLIGAEVRTMILQRVSTDLNGFYVTESELIISSSIKSDSGSFTCRATNVILGSVRYAMRIFNVRVYCKSILAINHARSIPYSIIFLL